MEQDPLAQLKDIHLPLQYETGLPAFGFWLIAAIIIILLVLVVFWLRKRRQQHQAQQYYLTQLRQIDIKDPLALNKVNKILKLSALHYFDRALVANLHGKTWLKFLDSQLKNIDASFMSNSEEWLQLYKKSKITFTNEQLQLAHTWLQHALPPKKDRLHALLELKENNHV